MGEAANPRRWERMRRRKEQIALLFAALGACGSGSAPLPFAVGESEGVTLVTELPEGRGRLRNATLNYGTFFVARKCLQLRVGGDVFTPVLPHGARLAEGASAIMVGGRRFEAGRRYSLPFASEVGPDPDEVARAIRLPPRCAQRLMSIGAPV